jgi:excisionase family DNA binding protein
VNFEKRISNIEELPLALNVIDIAHVLGLSKQNAYALCHRRDFPSVKIGKRIIVPRLAFERWMEDPKNFKQEEN